MAPLVTIYVANMLERGILEIETWDRAPSSEEWVLFFKVEIMGDKISHFALCFLFSNELVCTGHLCKGVSKVKNKK